MSKLHHNEDKVNFILDPDIPGFMP